MSMTDPDPLDVFRRLPADDLVVNFGEPVHESTADYRKRMDEYARIEREDAERRQRIIEEREAKRLGDALKTFRRFGACPSAFVCLSCSALVEDRAAHVRWHDSLNETARKAADADWRGRPIG